VRKLLLCAVAVAGGWGAWWILGGQSSHASTAFAQAEEPRRDRGTMRLARFLGRRISRPGSSSAVPRA
jgi:hypothetical protein